MENTSSLLAESTETDPLLDRLQGHYVRQNDAVAAQTRKHMSHGLQEAAAYYSSLPVSLELISGDTAGLFDEVQQLLESQCKQKAITSRGVALLQRIRAQVNRELRASLSYIEQGYTSGFEKLLRASELREGSVSPPKASASPSIPSAPATTAPTPRKKQSDAREASVEPTAVVSPPSSHLALREVFSGFLGTIAESLAVLMQCEVVRIYLYDTHSCLQCVAQFPYRATHADPMHSHYLALMAAREVHDIVCRERIAVNGRLSGAQTTSSSSEGASEHNFDGENSFKGPEDIRTCLLVPIFSPQGLGKSYGMIHAVNKQFPSALGVQAEGVAEDSSLGFNADDEVVASGVSRVIGTIVSRYPFQFFFANDSGEKLRRRAFPGDTEVLSLTAHLPPVLQDEVKEATNVAQQAMSCLSPILVYRVSMKALYEKRLSEGNGHRRRMAQVRPRAGTVPSVEFNLRCMNELWEKSRGDNITLHTEYRILQEKVHRCQLLLRNLLDGVATARAMPLSTDVAQYLHNIEMYGRSERTERMAAYVSEKMLAIPISSARQLEGTGTGTKNHMFMSASDDEIRHMSDAELRTLRKNNTRLNTMTPSSLHFEGPGGVRGYTSDPVQKRQQVRFIDELRKLAEEKPLTVMSVRKGNPRRQAHTPSLPHVSHGAVANARISSKRYLTEDERPFKL